MNVDETNGTVTGPRGGTTTVSKSGMLKKNLWVPPDMGEWLRDMAYVHKMAEADIIREAIDELRAKQEAGRWPKR